jgi:hypothetical protein
MLKFLLLLLLGLLLLFMGHGLQLLAYANVIHAVLGGALFIAVSCFLLLLGYRVFIKK